ncbi:VOC family protein [Mesorhizobium sp. M0924]|uniref:VOC family protein n=1 Tax=unclassified Mesorhizobium TaxID=325217 RepID=UPI00333B54CD
MIKVKQLAHVCIFAHDLEATRAFYRDVLGLDTQFNFLRDGKVFGFYLNCGDRSHVEVFQKDGTSHSELNQINHFCLEVETSMRRSPTSSRKALISRPRSMPATTRFRPGSATPTA